MSLIEEIFSRALRGFNLIFGKEGSWKDRLAVIAIAIAYVGVMFGFLNWFDTGNIETPKYVFREEFDSIVSDLALISTDIDNVNARLGTLTEIDDDILLKSKIEDLELTFMNFDQRLGIIENAILENPEKALEIVLIRNDYDNLEYRLLLVESSIDRVFNLNKWVSGIFIGLITIVGVGFVKTLIDSVVARENQREGG